MTAGSSRRGAARARKTASRSGAARPKKRARKGRKKPASGRRGNASAGIPAATADRFVDRLIERGEAVPADADGELPAGATHEIVATGEDGRPVVRRRRFTTV